MNIYVEKPATKVSVMVVCSSKSTRATEEWDGPGGGIPLRHNAFRVTEQHATIDLVQSGHSTQYKAAMFFTGKFKGDEFVGQVHIGDSSCPQTRYTAKYTDDAGH